MVALRYFLPLLLLWGSPSGAGELWEHLSAGGKRPEARGMEVRWSEDQASLQLKVQHGPEVCRGVTWVSVPPPEGGWDCAKVERIEAKITNSGEKEAKVTLWVVGSNGWGAVGEAATLKPGQSGALRCPLRETYPDGTPKLDPKHIAEVRIMVHGADGALLDVSGLRAMGEVKAWVRPEGRLDLPGMTAGKPAAGARVRYQLEGERGSGVYSALYLPVDWVPGKRYPVVAELPGNLFFNASSCWSDGRPEQCAMGYGMTKGKGAIWISLPFVDRSKGAIAEFGYGSRQGLDTVAHTRAAIAEICARWGGDPENLVLCGFSRGAIACGYIGLRDDGIAKLWKGFVPCQHYDGSWGTTMDGAVERAPRFQGQAIFQVDNPMAKYQRLVEVTDPAVKWTWGQSGLNYHATAMFLDDRPLMKELCEWFADLTGKP